MEISKFPGFLLNRGTVYFHASHFTHLRTALAASGGALVVAVYPRRDAPGPVRYHGRTP